MLFNFAVTPRPLTAYGGALLPKESLFSFQASPVQGEVSRSADRVAAYFVVSMTISKSSVTLAIVN